MVVLYSINNAFRSCLTSYPGLVRQVIGSTVCSSQHSQRSKLNNLFSSHRPSSLNSTNTTIEGYSHKFTTMLLVLHAPLIALSQLIGAHGTDVSVGVRLLSGEILLQAKNSTGRRWDSNPGPYRQHGHCCKRAKPLRHLDMMLVVDQTKSTKRDKQRSIANKKKVLLNKNYWSYQWSCV